jgi:hypothetical protein
LFVFAFSAQVHMAQILPLMRDRIAQRPPYP